MWDGKQWRPVSGCRYKTCGSDEEGVCQYVDEWPALGSYRLDHVTPWVQRLEIFDDICLDSLRHQDERGMEFAPLRMGSDDAAVIRAIHGSGS
jgi:hypothetical protein